MWKLTEQFISGVWDPLAVMRLYICVSGCLLALAGLMGMGVAISSPRVTAVSVFKPEESDLHKYSAVLAATEPIRLRCELEIRKSLNPFSYIIYKLRGVNFKDPSGILRIENKAIDAACTRYENRVEEVVQSYGLTQDLFNNMSRESRGAIFEAQGALAYLLLSHCRRFRVQYQVRHASDAYSHHSQRTRGRSWC